jgi:signal transduction histidine kinase
MSEEIEKSEPAELELEKLHSVIEELERELELKDRLLAGNLLDTERVGNKLRQILAAMSSAVLMIELDGYISEANPKARELLDVEGNLPLLASNVLPEKLQDILDEVIGEGSHVQIDSLIVDTRDADSLTLKVDCRLVRDDVGNPIGVLQIIDDRTHISRMEKRLEQSGTLAALGEMAASVAHELRNPLGGIGGFAALLKDMLPRDSTERRYTMKIIEGVDGLNKVATNLLAYTRPVDPILKQIDLRQLMREVLSFVQIEIEQYKYPIKLSINLSDDPEWVMMDPELMRQCFINLFKNAVQAMQKSGGTLECNFCRIEDERIVVEVIDDGPGIPLKLQTKLFNPFFTTKAKGTGLGLAIVRKNVELHAGTVELESSEGNGACFMVNLPLCSSKEIAGGN